MGRNMNVLYIYAHQEHASFNAALKATALETLEKAGYTVRISDLYAVNFKPVLDASDFLQRKKKDVFNPFLEQRQQDGYFCTRYHGRDGESEMG
jgi:NAD(P)H dehydrogenase (quinone)